jgi:hypothetical protein
MKFSLQFLSLAASMLLSSFAAASQVQHQVCRDERHAVTVRRGDADAPSVAQAVRQFLSIANSAPMLSRSQLDALAGEGVSYVYTAHVCATDGDGADAAAGDSDFDGRPQVGDVEDIPGANAPNGSSMTLTTCSHSVQLVVTYTKTDDGWVVTDVHEYHVQFCPLGN